MSGETAPSTTRRPRAVARVRLLILLVLLASLFLPWTTAQTPFGVAYENGFDRLGGIVVPLLLALWGLAATSLLAATAVAARLGAAFTDVAVAMAGAALLGTSHSWVSDALLGMHQASVLTGLATLALIQAVLLLARSPLEREVAWIRAAAAFAVGVIFLYGGGRMGLAAGLSFWLALSSASVALYRPRVEIEVLSLLAAGLVCLAPLLRLVERETSGVYLGYYLWLLAGFALTVLAGIGLAVVRQDAAGTQALAR